MSTEPEVEGFGRSYQVSGLVAMRSLSRAEDVGEAAGGCSDVRVEETGAEVKGAHAEEERPLCRMQPAAYAWRCLVPAFLPASSSLRTTFESSAE